MTFDGSSSADPSAAASIHTYGQLTPTALSWFVVGRYWQLVHERPSDLTQLYHPDAHLSRTDGGPAPTQLRGRSDIAAYYAGQAQGAFVYIKSIDCVPTGAQQFLTQVVGEVALPSDQGGVQPFCRFSQSLIFASAASPSDSIETPGLISIFSDILRLEPDEAPAPAPSANGFASQITPAQSTSTPAPPASSAPSSLGQKAEELARAAPVSNGVHPGQRSSAAPDTLASAANSSAPSPASAPPLASTTTQTTTPSNLTAVPSTPAVPTPAAPKQPTWASLAAAKQAGEAGQSTSARVAGPTPSTAPQRASRRLSTVSATSSAVAASEVEGRKAVVSSTGAGNKSSKDSSVFVKAVVSAIKEPDLYEALSPFGRVVNVHMLPQKGGAFVDFDSPDSARRALTTSQAKKGIVVPTASGRPTIQVEPKRTRPADAKSPSKPRHSGRGRGTPRDTTAQGPKGESDGFQAVKGRRGH